MIKNAQTHQSEHQEEEVREHETRSLWSLNPSPNEIEPREKPAECQGRRQNGTPHPNRLGLIDEIRSLLSLEKCNSSPRRCLCLCLLCCFVGFSISLMPRNRKSDCLAHTIRIIAIVTLFQMECLISTQLE